jgi:hypothetical protein
MRASGNAENATHVKRLFVQMENPWHGFAVLRIGNR